MSPMWKYEEKELREDVRLNLPNHWKCQVFKVTSGDTGKEYWVQIIGSGGHHLNQIVLCDCPEGKFHQPLTVLGLKDFICKHGQNLLAFLKDKKN